jgi:hypothetical protein
MTFACRLPELEFGLQCVALDWCYVYLEQRSEVMLLFKQFEAIDLKQCVDVRIPCTCSELIYATLRWHQATRQQCVLDADW